MAPSLLVDGSNSHHDDVVDPFKGVPSFRYSVTQRGSSSIGPLLFPSLDSSLEVSRNGSLSSNDRRDHSEAADESKKSLKLGNDSDNDDCTLSSSLVIGGGAARTNVSSTNNIHNKSSEIHLTRGRHGKLPTKIRTKNEQRVNTMSSTNRRFSAPVTPIADLATGIQGEEMEDRVQSPGALRQRRGFSKYLKYDTKTAAAEAGKYKRRSDTSSAIADVSILRQDPPLHRVVRRTISSPKAQRRPGAKERKRSRPPSSPRKHSTTFDRAIPRRRVSSPMMRRRRSSYAHEVNGQHSLQLVVRGEEVETLSTQRDERVVSFCDQVDIIRVPHAVDLLSDHYKDPYRILWFNDHDYDTIYNRSCDLIDNVIYDGQLPPTKGKDGRVKVALHKIQRKPTSLLTSSDIPTLPKCVRGIESLVHSIDKDRESIKAKAWDAVLDEQYMQKKQYELEQKEKHKTKEYDNSEPDNEQSKFEVDDIEISNVYKVHTFKNQREAYKRGQHDAKISLKYLEDTKRHVDKFQCRQEDQTKVPRDHHFARQQQQPRDSPIPNPDGILK